MVVVSDQSNPASVAVDDSISPSLSASSPSLSASSPPQARRLDSAGKSGVFLVLVSATTTAEHLESLAFCKQRVLASLRQQRLLHAIADSMAASRYTAGAHCNRVPWSWSWSCAPRLVC